MSLFGILGLMVAYIVGHFTAGYNYPFNLMWPICIAYLVGCLRGREFR